MATARIPPDRVRVSSNDQTQDFLGTKVVAGAGIAVTELNDGGVETLEIQNTGSISTWTEDEFTPTLGQVTFILSVAPTDLDSFSLHVNGIIYDDVADYTVSGTTLTWLNTPFSLETTDQLIAKYQ